MATQTKAPKRVVHHLPITKARINLGQVVRRAHLNHECFILEKDGIPVAGILNVDDMEDWLELQDPGMRQQIADGYAKYQRGETTSLDDLLADGKQPRPRGKKGAR
ncbi:MAG: type II toxin-antitoxin system Phd/YefM family antitoxin [Gemmatimonadota bacterium]